LSAADCPIENRLVLAVYSSFNYMAVIYLKTPTGQTALHSRAVQLTPRQRSAFIMFDGKRSLDEVLKLTAGIGVTPADVEQLVALDLLATLQGSTSAATLAPAPPPQPPPPAAILPSAIVSSPPAAPAAPAASSSAPSAEAQASYLKAYPVATRLTSDLGFRGFRLNLAVEAAGSLQQLRELAPKIRAAVGDDKFKALEDALR
jgi:hypothetical protein